MRDYKPDTVEVARLKPLRSKRMKELQCYVLRALNAEELNQEFNFEGSNRIKHVTIQDQGEFVMLELDDDDHILLPTELVTIKELEET